MPLPILRKWLGLELIEVSTTEKFVSAAGGGLSIWLLMASTSWVLPHSGTAAVLTSMGASAVLLFAVPHGQLSQPWPVIAGHGFSALIGVLCAKFLSHPLLAAACAVGFAIGVMHQLKCIHPPGGATAFAAVMGGQAIQDLGFRFVLFPVLLNAVQMVLLAFAINYAFRWRRYPTFLTRAPHPPPPLSLPTDAPPTHADVVAAVRSLDTFVDISEEDLLRLVELLAHHPTIQNSTLTRPPGRDAPPVPPRLEAITTTRRKIPAHPDRVKPTLRS